MRANEQATGSYHLLNRTGKSMGLFFAILGYLSTLGEEIHWEAYGISLILMLAAGGVLLYNDYIHRQYNRIVQKSIVLLLGLAVIGIALYRDMAAG